MKKSLIAASLLVSSSAFADQCDVNVKGELSVVDQVITITTEAKDKIVIEPDYQVFYNGRTVDLNSEQQQWVKQYYTGIYDAIPVVANLALDGVQIAAVALDEVFNTLFDGDNDALADITAKLEELRGEIQHNFYANDGSIRLESTRFEDGDFLGQQWENEFEELVEDAVTSSIGHLMVAIGSEMIFSGGDMNAFEQRMESFAEQIEHNVERKAELLEQRADALCLQLADLDDVENRLQSSVSQFDGLNMINVSKDRRM